MIEMGQPSHAFDLARVPGGKLVVRWSRAGREAHDPRRRRADAARARGRHRRAGRRARPGAGRDHGRRLERDPRGDTRSWRSRPPGGSPLAVRRGARALGMHTEASHRFERGADVAAGPVAIARLAHLLAKIGGGHRAARARRAQGPRAPGADRAAAAGAGERAPRRRGAAPPAGADPRVARLPRLRLRPRGDRPRARPGASTSRARRTSRRRWAGTSGCSGSRRRCPPATRPGRLRPSQRRERRIRDVLTGVGLIEVINYAFVAGAADGRAAARSGTRLANPLTEEQDTLRTSLVMPGLLDTLRTNLRLGRRDVAIFELGRVFTGGRRRAAGGAAAGGPALRAARTPTTGR